MIVEEIYNSVKEETFLTSDYEKFLRLIQLAEIRSKGFEKDYFGTREYKFEDDSVLIINKTYGQIMI